MESKPRPSRRSNEVPRDSGTDPATGTSARFDGNPPPEKGRSRVLGVLQRGFLGLVIALVGVIVVLSTLLVVLLSVVGSPYRESLLLLGFLGAFVLAYFAAIHIAESRGYTVDRWR